MNLGEQQEMQKQKASYANQSTGLCGEATIRRRTQREEAQHRMENASLELERASRAALFFGDHPEFDEFIQLVRAGVIQI